MSKRYYSNTASQAALAAAIGATDTAITLTAGSFTGYPTQFPYTAAIARGTADEEIVLVTAASGDSVTVTRAFDGTLGKAHGAGATFTEVVVALDYREANDHLNATSGVHGVAGNVVGDTDAQTLTNKTLTNPTVTDGTFTGVQAVAEAHVTTLTVTGVTTLVGFAASGNGTVGGTFSVTGVTTLAALTASGLITANGGLTVPTGKKVTLTDAPAAGTDAANKAYADAQASAAQTAAQAFASGLFTSPPASRKLPEAFGSVTAFPTTNLVVGDTCYRSDLAATFTYNGTGWNQASVPTYASNTARDAVFTTTVKTSLPDGFRIYHSGLKATQTWDAAGSAWRFTLSGVATVTSDANGTALVPHGAGQAPLAVALTHLDSGDAVNKVIKWMVQTTDATNIQVRAIRTDTSQYLTGNAGLNLYWTATF